MHCTLIHPLSVMHLTLQGIVPTEAEGRVIRKLTESQFSQLSPSDDVLVEDPDLTTGVDMLTLTVHSSIVVLTTNHFLLKI